MALVFQFVMFVVLCVNAFVSSRPEFVVDTSPLIVKENKPPGVLLRKLTAVDRANPSSRLSIKADSSETERLVNITNDVYSNDTEARVVVDAILAAKLDWDFEPTQRTLYFKVTNEDDTDQSDTVTILLMIEDVHDTPPSFENLPYVANVPENAEVGDTVFRGVSASDPDNAAQLAFSLQTVDEPFEIASLTGVVTLTGSLDYETMSFYRLKIIVTDNINMIDTADIDISVTDVQDTPPYFLNAPYRADILEEQPTDTFVIQVSAVDGDRGLTNSISYKLSEGPHEYFAIDEQTGIITTKKPIDRDAEFMVSSGGIFKIGIQAEENNDTFPQTGNITASTHIIVRIEDVNDNWPTFDRIDTPYTAIVRSDVPNGTLISFENNGYIFVFDRDQDMNSKVSLTIEQNGKVCEFLEAMPSEVYSEGFILFRITDNQYFNRTQSTVQETFKVVARETSTLEKHTSVATVVITTELAIPTTTPAPKTLSDTLGASDIVVFVVCSLLVINFIATIASCYYIFRNRKKYGFGMRRLNEYFYTPNAGQMVSDENKDRDNRSEARDNRSEADMTENGSGLEFYNTISISNRDRRNTTTSETPSALISTDIVPIEQSPGENTTF